jgi:cell wall-associated NlpC family hydrolase
MDKVERALDDLRRKFVPDARLGVWDVQLQPEQITGTTSSREALEALRRLGRELQLTERVRLLPDPVLKDQAAVVTAAVAPLTAEPKLSAARVSEALQGETLALLERQDDWLRVRAGDDYIAWVNAGYVAIGPVDWATDWAERATALSLGAEVYTPQGRRRLPTGARVALRRSRAAKSRDETVELADGTRGSISAGAIRAEKELRVEARHLALPELAQKWYGGAPYLWGGRTEWGIDCSGLAQAIYAARGIRLPRDSDQQFAAGQEIPLAESGAGYEAGDLLFFTERGRVSHVAFWAGAGRIVHAALSRGGVGGDHLFGTDPRMQRLRANLVGVRRPLPDSR